MPEAARADRFMRALLVCSAAVPLLLFAALSWYLRGERLEDGAEHVRQTAAVVEENALRVFEAQQLIIDRVDQYVAGMSWDEIRRSEAVHRFLRRAADASPHVDGLWLIPPSGRTANSADLFPFPPIDARDRDYFRALQERDELFFGEMIVGKTKGTLNFNISRRRAPRDAFNGLILVTASLEYFTDFWDEISQYRGHVVTLVRPDGEILARYPPVESLPDPLPPSAPLLQAIGVAEAGTYTAPSMLDGKERVYGYSRVGDYPVFVAYGVEKDAVLAPWRAELIGHGLVALSASVLLSGVSLLALRQTRRLGKAMASWRGTAQRLSSEVNRREKAEDIAAEKERLLAELATATAQRKAILDNMLEGVVAYRDDGQVIYCNQAAREILRLGPAELPPLDTLAREGRITTADGTPVPGTAGPVARLLQGERLVQEDLRLALGGDKPEIVCRFSGAPVHEKAGGLGGGVLTFADVTEEKADEERRALLMNELDHRVRNMLATISAMVRLSSSGSDSKEALVQTLSGRIGAMTRTHGLLTRSSWRGAVLHDILRDEVQPYANDDRVVIEGKDDVVLAPQDAVDFALVIHELATNAAKYGAWSGPEGRVEVSWSLVNGAAPGVRVLWRERDGPPVEAPGRVGFGSSLIRSAFRREGAGVDLRHEPDGVTCEIRIPLRAGPALRPLATAADPRPSARAQSLAGMRVLLVEDEPVVRLELASLLAEAGAEVIGPAANVAEGRSLAESASPDAAVLDINLGGESVAPLAEALIARNVDVVFTSGYRNLELLPPALRQLPLLQKPVRPDHLVGSLANRGSPRSVAG